MECRANRPRPATLAWALLLAGALSAAGQDAPPGTRFAELVAEENAGKKDEEPGRAKKNAPGEPKEKEGKNGEDKTENGKDEKKKNGDKDEDKDKGKKAGDLCPDWLSAHGQGTVVSQGNWPFHSPYQGPNSLLPILNYRTTATTTLYLDGKLWDGADLVFNPEVSGGRGLSRTTGLAGFPNGEATRVDVPQPTPYVARLIYRQTIGLGGEREDVEDGPNQLPGKRDIARVTFRAGKFAATDVFDDNAYSHDPRTQFLNWALMANGAWDYPANTRGYDYGATIELNQKDWAWRYGVFGEPTVANGQDIDPQFLRANGHATEFEYRYKLADLAGKARLLAYWNNAHMGSYREALDRAYLDGGTPDVTATRTYRSKYGVGLNLEQEVADDLGAFARAGWNDGQTESWAFAEIDRTVSAGLVWKGVRWARPGDRFGLAFVANGLSDAHRDYLAAGGIGFIIGDGTLRYGWEQILEAYYSLRVREGILLSFDLQGVKNPAYNRDRGPAAIAAVRAHFEY